MERTMLTFDGRGTSTQVLLSMRALYSSHIACFQLGSRRAWKGDLGMGEEVVTCKLYLGLAFTIPTLERVTIGCCEVDGGGGGGGGVVAGGVGVVCGDGVGRGVGGVDCGVVCGVVCQGTDIRDDCKDVIVDRGRGEDIKSYGTDIHDDFDSLLLTPLCCDDIHDVTPRVSTLAGCDRLVSEPLVIEKCVIIERCSLGSSVNFSRIDLRIWLSSIKRVHEEDIPKTAFRTWPEVAHGVKGRERDNKNSAWPGPTNGKEGREGADKTYYDLRDMYGGHVWRMISTYVSNCLTCLKKYLADTNLHVHLEEIKVDKTFRFVEEPVGIIDREVKSLKRSRILIVKSIGTRSEVMRIS
ncbi:hypothetical protein Tco_1284782 [Tanacetum coccineum]